MSEKGFVKKAPKALPWLSFYARCVKSGSERLKARGVGALRMVHFLEKGGNRGRKVVLNTVQTWRWFIVVMKCAS